jgi:hypothetical protein
MKVVFLTDGIPRKININKQLIAFKQSPSKMFAFRGEVTPLIVAAMKEIGKSKIADTDLILIKKALTFESKDLLISDAHLAPRWITQILLKLINE